MTQYRLLDNTVDVIEATDEFWDAMTRKWKVVPCDIVGEKFYAVIPYRRAIPEPEPVKQEPTIDPGEGYRLVQDDEIVLPTDQRAYTKVSTSGWDIPPQKSTLGKFIQEGHTCALIKDRQAWKDIVFRRRVTKKIVLKEYVVSYNEDYSLEWWVEKPKGGSVYATGQEREIEIPA